MSKARDIADLDTAELAGGAGSGLDADTLDGQQGAFYTAYADTAVSTANVVAALTAGNGVDISAGGTVSVSAVAITTVQTAVSEIAHLALSTQEGDVVVRSDLEQTFMHNGGVAGTIADFTLLTTPTDAVASVNGLTGVVTLDNSSLTGGAVNATTGQFSTSLNVDGTATMDGIVVDAAGDVAFGTKFFWDASAESLGIGTSSPSDKLSVGTSVDSDSVVTVTSTATSNNTQLRLGTSGNDSVISGTGGSNGALAFKVFGAERMRIDSSGNLLLNRNSVFTTAKMEIQSDAGDASTLALNSIDTDGSMLEFYKSGNTVGSIGTDASGNLQTLSASGNYRFGDSNTTRWSVDATRMYPMLDGTYDIGTAGVRVRDLYLSGGVYLGGTGSANKLDDYEEGTWSPVIRTGTSASWTSVFTENSYTKIGSLVTISLAGTMTATATTPQSNLYVASAVPFASRSFSPLVGYGLVVDGGEGGMKFVNTSLAYPISKLSTVVPAKTVGQTSDFKIFLQYHTNT